MGMCLVAKKRREKDGCPQNIPLCACFPSFRLPPGTAEQVVRRVAGGGSELKKKDGSASESLRVCG